jgi:hypothetical protein
MTAKRVFKKKKKLSGGPRVFRKWKEWAEGDYVIGTFVGTYIDNYDKEGTLVEVIEANFPKRPKLSAKLEGKTLALNATGQLNKALPKMEEGNVYQFTYGGTSTMEGGKYAGKESHLVEVTEVTEDDDDAFETEEEDEDEDFDL